MLAPPQMAQVNQGINPNMYYGMQYYMPGFYEHPAAVGMPFGMHPMQQMQEDRRVGYRAGRGGPRQPHFQSTHGTLA